jgi:hypothetical protein
LDATEAALRFSFTGCVLCRFYRREFSLTILAGQNDTSPFLRGFSPVDASR